MQMKVVVDTPSDYKKWLNEKTTLVQEIKTANTPAPAPAISTESAVKDSTKTAVVATVVDAKLATK
jgi:cytochrome c oxidase subunit 2